MPERVAGSTDPTPQWLSSPVLVSGVLVAIALVTRLPFFFGSALGEADAARLLQDALLWDKAGLRSEALSGYRYYVSSGYILLSRGVIHLSAFFGMAPAVLLNMLNLIAGIVAPVLVYKLVRSLLDPGSALVAGITFLAMPTVWYGSLYGFPHLLSLTCILGALVLYAEADPEPLSSVTPAAGRLLAIVLLLVAAVSVKGDTYLAAGALPGLALIRFGLDWKAIAIAVILVVVPALLGTVLGAWILQDGQGLISYMRGYRARYPLDTDLLGSERIEGIADSFGRYVFVLAALGCLLALGQRKIKLVLLVGLLAVPMLFWVLRPGDSMRHHVNEAPAVALAASLGWRAVPGLKTVKTLVLALAVLGSHLVEPPFLAYDFPSSNVVRTAPRMRDQARGWTTAAMAFAEADACPRVLLGALHEPYANVALLLRTADTDRVHSGQQFGWEALTVEYRHAGQQCTAITVRTGPATAEQRLGVLEQAGVAAYVAEWDWPRRRLSQVPHLHRIVQGQR